jgi:hypothetical protein
MTDYEVLIPSEDGSIPSEDDSTPTVYTSYKRRWFYLFVVCLAQISNALVG